MRDITALQSILTFEDDKAEPICFSPTPQRPHALSRAKPSYPAAAMASRIAYRAASRAFSTTSRRMQDTSEHVLKQESKRNPELMVRQILQPRQQHETRRGQREGAQA